MSPLELICPACQCALRVPGAAPGRRVRCPRCNEVFAVPAGAGATPAAEPVAPPVAAPAAAPAAKPAGNLPSDDDFFATIAAADDPVAAAADARKPKPTPGEPDNPLPLDEEPPPAKPKAKPRKAASEAKTEKKPKKRRAAEYDEDESRAAAGISPLWLIGGLSVLAAGMLAVGVFVVMRQHDKRAEEAAEVERVRELAAAREQEREREAARPKPEPPKPGPAKPPVEDPPGPGRAEDPGLVPVGPAPGPGLAPGLPPGLPAEIPPFEPPVRPPLRPPIRPPVRPPFEPPVRPPFEPPAIPPGFGPPGVGMPGVGMPEKPKIVFPPVTPVAIKPAPLTQDKVELKLPGTVTDACIGGGGRYWCLLMGDEKQVAIFDVNAAKVAKYLPVAAGKARVAAGMNKLVVTYPDTGALARYDLTTFEKEVTAKAPIDRFDSVMMGSASAGPLYIGTTPVDLTTFKTFGGPVNAGGFGFGNGMHYRVSPDGHVIGSWSTSFTPSGLNVGTVGETGVKPFSQHMVAGFVLPAADGTTVTAVGVYGPTGKQLGGPDGCFFRLPAQEGKFYLTIPGGGGAQRNTGMGDVDSPTTVYSTGEARALVKLPNVALPAGNEAWAAGDFFADKKVLFTTEGKLIAVLDKTANKLVLHRFDLESALDKAGIDYLFVTSRPPVAEPGKPFKYTPVVKSKRGGTTFKLDAGPAGMKVAADGTVTWSVPKDWAGGESVILTISDKSGQEIFHTFTLTAAPGADGAAGGPAVGPGPGPVAIRPDVGAPAPAPEPGDPKSGLVRPAARPAKLTPTKAADGTQIKLPGTVDMTCFGGGGRYVLLRMPGEKQVALLDVCEGKVTKYFPIPEDSALVAAGNEHLFVLAPTANVIQRWNLTTFEKEVTVANPLKGAPRKLLVGHATDGPLFVVGPNAALDPKTFKPLDLGEGAGGRGMGAMAGHPSHPPTVRVSADGRVFAWHTQGLSPSGLSSMVLGATGSKCHYEHETVGAIIPGPDGTLFTGGGLFTPELKPIGEKGRYQYWHHAPVPAAHGKLYLSIAPDDLPGGRRAAPKVSLKMLGENKPLLDLADLAGLDIPKDHNQTAARGLQLHDRVFIVPDAKAIAVLHATADKVTIHKLDIEAALDKAGIDYLFVTSRPPGAVCGAMFTYKPEVRSRQGGVKVKLDAGPDGMKVAADGTVTWNVPENFADSSVNVILTIGDKSGQETFHTFNLPVASRP